MASLKTLVEVSVGLSFVLGVIAALSHDWMWVVIDALNIIMLAIPHIKDLGYYYDKRIAGMTMVAPVFMIAVFLLSFLLPLHDSIVINVPLYDYISGGVEAFQCFMIGFMVALVVDRSFGMTMTNGWMVLFSLVFAMTLIALDFFFVVGSMYFDGVPIFNEDYADSDGTANSTLMTTPLVATFLTAFMAVVLYRRLRGIDKTSFTRDREVAA